MTTFMAFVLGLLVGWIVEWIIDWIYWRRRSANWIQQENLLREQLKESEAKRAELENQLSIQKTNLAAMQEKRLTAEAELNPVKTQIDLQPEVQAVSTRHVRLDESIQVPPAAVKTSPVAHDDLIIIKGIGPVIAKKLNEAGIYTFAELAEMTPERLRELVGDTISRLADEDSIIEQAKQLAAEKSRGG